MYFHQLHLEEIDKIPLQQCQINIKKYLIF